MAPPNIGCTCGGGAQHLTRSRAIVIGSGFGGLAAAVRLRCLGYDVELLEALDRPGGRARVFARDGFTFDAGPTVITAPYLLEELFSLAGHSMRDYVELLPVDPFYRVMFDDGSSFDYVGDEERLIAQIAAFEPRDVDGYRRLAQRAAEIFEIGYTQLADRPFGNVTDMLRVVPAMMRLESWRTVHGLVARYIRDERLRRVFTFEPLLVGGNPFEASSIYLLIHWLGGSGAYTSRAAAPARSSADSCSYSGKLVCGCGSPHPLNQSMCTTVASLVYAPRAVSPFRRTSW